MRAKILVVMLLVASTSWAQGRDRAYGINPEVDINGAIPVNQDINFGTGEVSVSVLSVTTTISSTTGEFQDLRIGTVPAGAEVLVPSGAVFGNSVAVMNGFGGYSGVRIGGALDDYFWLHHSGDYAMWTAARDIYIDPTWNGLAPGTLIFASAPIQFPDLTGDKISLYSGSYKLGVSSLAFDFTSDAYFKWHSDTNPDAMILNGDTGDLSLEGGMSVSGGLSASTLNTGQGANELYDMDQNVLTTSTPTFDGITSTDHIILSDDKRVGTSSTYWTFDDGNDISTQSYVALGTTSADRRLTVVGDVLLNRNDSDRIEGRNSGGSVESMLWIDSNDRLVHRAPSGGKHTFQIGTSDKAVIGSNGYFGIGTTNPKALVDILGDWPLRITDSNADDTAKHGGIIVPAYDTSEEEVLMISAYNENGENIVVVGGKSSIQTSATEIQFYTAPSTGKTASTGAEQRAVIDNDGNFGIGVTDPPNILSVKQGGGNAIADGWDTYACFPENKDGLHEITADEKASIKAAFQAIRPQGFEKRKARKISNQISYEIKLPIVQAKSVLTTVDCIERIKEEANLAPSQFELIVDDTFPERWKAKHAIVSATDGSVTVKTIGRRDTAMLHETVLMTKWQEERITELEAEVEALKAEIKYMAERR